MTALPMEWQIAEERGEFFVFRYLGTSNGQRIDVEGREGPFQSNEEAQAWIDQWRPPMDTQKVTRVEVIDSLGRAYSFWQEGAKVTTSLQDDGRTLKIIIEAALGKRVFGYCRAVNRQGGVS